MERQRNIRINAKENVGVNPTSALRKRKMISTCAKNPTLSQRAQKAKLRKTRVAISASQQTSSKGRAVTHLRATYMAHARRMHAAIVTERADAQRLGVHPEDSVAPPQQEMWLHAPQIAASWSRECRFNAMLVTPAPVPSTFIPASEPSTSTGITNANSRRRNLFQSSLPDVTEVTEEEEEEEEEDTYLQPPVMPDYNDSSDEFSEPDTMQDDDDRADDDISGTV